MNAGIQAKVVATSFSLAAFTVAVIAGLAASNPALHVLVMAIVSMSVCYAIGRVIGAIVEKTVTHQMHVYRAARPVPEVIGLRDEDLTEVAEATVAGTGGMKASAA